MLSSIQPESKEVTNKHPQRRGQKEPGYLGLCPKNKLWTLMQTFYGQTSAYRGNQEVAELQCLAVLKIIGQFTIKQHLFVFVLETSKV